MGIYGDTGDTAVTEQSPAGNDFLADVCVRWEAAAAPAADAGIRVTHPRTGIVLSPNGGALAKLLPLFKLGVGGRMGSGTAVVELDQPRRRGRGPALAARPRRRRAGEPHRPGAGHQRAR